MRQLMLFSLLLTLGACPTLGCPGANSSDPVRFKAPMKTEVTSPFGPRLHDVLQVIKMHAGVDYGAAKGDPVTAAADGIVISAGIKGGYGKQIIIRHGFHYESSYSHLSKIDVAAGDCVSSGTRIGEAGSTGLVSEVHLHFALIHHGQFIDPLPLIGSTNRDP